jgi:crossover junction endodeoxyribonuclease RuvC
MRIAGIDCGTDRTGFGVVETDGKQHFLVTAGAIKTDSHEPLELRLKFIASELRRVFSEYGPAEMAVEEVFHAMNAKSALKLAHVRGVALLVAAEAGVPVSEYSPLEIKMSVVGYGRAEKHQVQTMVHSLLHTSREFESFDVTDALAVAICHGTRCFFPSATEIR